MQWHRYERVATGKVPRDERRQERCECRRVVQLAPELEFDQRSINRKLVAGRRSRALPGRRRSLALATGGAGGAEFPAAAMTAIADPGQDGETTAANRHAFVFGLTKRAGHGGNEIEESVEHGPSMTGRQRLRRRRISSVERESILPP